MQSSLKPRVRGDQASKLSRSSCTLSPAACAVRRACSIDAPGRCAPAPPLGQPQHVPAYGATLRACAASSSSDSLGVVLDFSVDADGEYCMPGEVTVQNDAHPEYTLLRIECQDYPGLFRVLAWVLNGLDVTVQNAQVDTTADGIAVNAFWLTDSRGKKLKPMTAELLAERVGDFIAYCTPDDRTLHAQHFSTDDIDVCNTSDDECTLVTIRYDKDKQRGVMLNIASVMSGMDCLIRKALIQACTECADPLDPQQVQASRQALFKFWVKDADGQKLQYARISALLYTLGLVLHNNAIGTAPPLTAARRYGQGVTTGDGDAGE